MTRWLANALPSVSMMPGAASVPTIGMPATRPVTSPAARTMTVTRSRSANPTMTTRTPIRRRYSIAAGPSLRELVALEHRGAKELAPHADDVVEADADRTRGLALVGVRARAEALLVHLCH